MHVDLDPQLARLIRKKVATGLYTDVDAVLREALRLLDDHDRLQRLRAAIGKGEQGDGIPFTAALVEQMKHDATRMAEEGARPNPDVLP